MKSFSALLSDIRSCQLCAEHLPHGPRPVLQVNSQARILLASQAPGRKVHESGVPFDDASGDRLRSWLGVSKEQFYDSKLIAILPMGFCYPGTGTLGDLPPRQECAPAWRSQVLSRLKKLQITLVIGHYAQAYHLPKGSVTELALAWRKSWPHTVPLPHPSPRNNLWLKRNPWFEKELIPVLRARVSEVLANAAERVPGRGLGDSLAES
jgi:uracil-DNA glycosylase